MPASQIPTLFLSHGAPPLALENSPAGRFLDGLGAQFPRPRAIVLASAHYGTAIPAVSSAGSPGTLHDFSGFAPALHRIRYPAPGDPALAVRIAELWRQAGIPARVDPERGLDHGAWVPLRRMYPAADIPVVSISVDPRGDAAAHMRLGSLLAPLRSEGVLVVGSGGFVHNLGELERTADGAAPDWAWGFADWTRSRLVAGDAEALLAWRERAPHASRAHPSVEHFMPLFIALGAAGETAQARPLHSSWEYGSLALDAFAFD